MPDTLSIRSYSTKPASHSHNYDQLVLPLSGVIAIRVGDFDGKVAPGECVIVRKHEEHFFAANPEARFVVADMHAMPHNLACFNGEVFALKRSFLTYLSFVGQQLEQQVNTELERAMFRTFYLLLAEQTLLPKVDNRIGSSLMFIEQNIQHQLSITMLAKVACLSSTQFKVLFKKQTGLTAMAYVAKLRMEKAQALLVHTDYSLQMVAEMVGYSELSTFSRKFSQQFGLSPGKFKK